MLGLQATSPLDVRLAPQVQAAMNGDRDAFASLVDASSHAVSSIALAICRDVAASEDVAQEAYLVAWSKLSELRNPASFLPWIRQITRYTARGWVRDKGAHNRSISSLSKDSTDDDGLDPLEGIADSRAGAERTLIEKEREQAMADALDELPEEAREVVLLYYREGRSTAQVAHLLGLSEAGVRKRLQRARDTLRRDVMERLASTAKASAPGAAFTVAVMAATTAAPTASALTGSAAASTGAGLASKLLVGLGGLGVGLAGGLLGVWIGLRRELQQALDDQERRQLNTLLVLAVSAVALACWGFASPALHGHWLGPVAVYAAFLFSLAALYLVWLPRILRRRWITQEGGENDVVRTKVRRHYRNALLGYLAGALSGGLGLWLGLWGSGLL